MHLASLASELNLSVNDVRLRASRAGIRIPPRATKVSHETAQQLLKVLGAEAALTTRSGAVVPEASGPVVLPSVLSVRELANELKQPVNSVIKKLVQNGVLATINENLDFETAAIIAQDFGVQVVSSSAASLRPGLGFVEEVIGRELPADLKERPVVVAVMGHVDHGKTTLLDAIRKTETATSESGGITQHIGAYSIEYKGKDITFLDTPGHEAFAAMRARGANVTDIIILVVAADDGVRPQTVEVINRAKFSNTPMIVAINKTDAPGANIQRVQQELATAGVLLEDWGGSILSAQVSAKQAQGVENLLELVLLQAELMELKANPNASGLGTVIEAHMQTGQGAVATVIAQNGEIKIGDTVFAGSHFGKIKSLSDDQGRKLKSISPGLPAQISGLSGLPEAGDILCVTQSLAEAKTRAEAIRKHEQSHRLRAKAQLQGDEISKQINLIIKADVAGSLEAVQAAVEKIKTSDVKVNIIQTGVGDINDSDVLLADTAKANIVAFRVKTSPTAILLAKQRKVVVDTYDIIYELIAAITDALLALSAPEYERTITGKLKVKAVFRSGDKEQIVGGQVSMGEIKSRDPLLIVRGEQELGPAKILELQREKIVVGEVEEGYECGLKIESRMKLQVGDQISAYRETLKSKTLTT